MEYVTLQLNSKKSKSGNSQTLITKRTDWANSSDSDEEVNYALMANVDNDYARFDSKVPQTTLASDTNEISKLRIFFKCLHVSYRDQTLENEKIKIENSDLRKINDHLEAELMFMIETQKERDDDVHVKKELLMKTAYLEQELAKEKEVIKTWTKSVKSNQELIENGCWLSGVGLCRQI